MEFNRIIKLLRTERGITQKQAAEDLHISQALLSHYEKGIRECGLEFVVKVADFYNVSTDYLLGRSPHRSGAMITVEDLPEPDAAGKENVFKGSLLPTLNKKLIANSLNILFDLLAKSGCKPLVHEVSSFLMLAVYRMFRLVHAANPHNQEAMFTIPQAVAQQYASAAMEISCANAASISAGEPVAEMERIPKPEALSMTTQGLGQNYPLFASSLLNLIQNAEGRIAYPPKPKG